MIPSYDKYNTCIKTSIDTESVLYSANDSYYTTLTKPLNPAGSMDGSPLTVVSRREVAISGARLLTASQGTITRYQSLQGEHPSSCHR